MTDEVLNVGVMTSKSGPLLAPALAEFPGLNVTWIEGPDYLAAHIDRLDVLFASNDFYLGNVAELVHRAPRLRYLQIVSSGFDNLKLHGAPARLVVARGGPNHAPTVAEHAVTLLLGLLRRLPDLERNRANARRWERYALRERIGSLENQDVLIVGFGAIGTEIARRIRPFRARAIGMLRHDPAPDVAALADRIVRPAELLAVLPQVDAVILALPLNDETAKTIGARELAAMKRSAYLINIARGGVVDQAALIDALEAGTIAGAGLDVFEDEPLSTESPLWDFEQVILSPHVAGSGSDDGTRRTIDLARENLHRFRSGRPLLYPVEGYAS